MDEARNHENSPEVMVHALEVVRPFEHGGVLGLVAFVDAREWAQEVAQSRPDAFQVLQWVSRMPPPSSMAYSPAEWHTVR